VLFDEGHGQKFLIGERGQLDLSRLAGVFQAEGAQIKASREALTDARLSGVDGLVVSGPFTPFTPAEIEAVTRFLDRGGRLSVMLHIPHPVAPLLHRLGVDFSNGIIRERANVIHDDPLNFHVTALSAHALTRQLDAFDVFGAWALLSTNANVAIIAQTSPTAWVDLNGNNRLDVGDAVQSFGVAVAGQFGSGRFAVFGDDAIFQNQFLTGGNVVLARNLVGWLTQAAPSATPDGQRHTL
jgi:hypothetical protein